MTPSFLEQEPYPSLPPVNSHRLHSFHVPHFGHPHPDVVARYRRFGSKIWITTDNGPVTFEWNDSGDMRVLTANQARFFLVALMGFMGWVKFLSAYFLASVIGQANSLC